VKANFLINVSLMEKSMICSPLILCGDEANIMLVNVLTPLADFGKVLKQVQNDGGGVC